MSNLINCAVPVGRDYILLFASAVYSMVGEVSPGCSDLHVLTDIDYANHICSSSSH